jgi:hypothetical protein
MLFTKIIKVKKGKLSRALQASAKVETRNSSYSFLTSTLDGVSGQRHVPAALYPREKTSGTHWIGGWVGLRTGLDTEARGKIIFLCQGSNHGRPVCSQALTD